MDPNITLREIRRLVHGYAALREDAPDRSVKVNGLLFCLTESVMDLGRWLSGGGFLPKEWDSNHGMSTMTPRSSGEGQPREDRS